MCVYVLTDIYMNGPKIQLLFCETTTTNQFILYVKGTMFSIVKQFLFYSSVSIMLYCRLISIYKKILDLVHLLTRKPNFNCSMVFSNLHVIYLPTINPVLWY